MYIIQKLVFACLCMLNMHINLKSVTHKITLDQKPVSPLHRNDINKNHPDCYCYCAILGFSQSRNYDRRYLFLFLFSYTENKFVTNCTIIVIFSIQCEKADLYTTSTIILYYHYLNYFFILFLSYYLN